MNKILVFSLIAIILSANFVFAEEDGMYEDKFKPSMYKVKTNPIAEWMDNQVNKSYVQKKQQNAQKETTQNNTTQKTAPQPKRVYSTGGWSS